MKGIDMVTVKEFVTIVIKEDGKKISQLKSGDDLCVAKNKWMTKNRVVDWRNDHYQETITDPETGEVARHCDEKLSEHRNRGSAKRKSNHGLIPNKLCNQGQPVG